MPSFTLLTQSILAGIFTGSLYGVLGLGLSLSWGLLRVINLSNFALAFLGAYLTYQLGTSFGLDPFISMLLLVGPCFLYGVALHFFFTRYQLKQFVSLLATFGITLIIEAMLQWFWTADYRKYETIYGDSSLRVGTILVPVAGLLLFLTAVALSFGTWGWLRWSYVGRAIRASSQEPQIAAVFGVNHQFLALIVSGVSAAFAGVAGGYIAIIYTLAPSQMWAWVGVVFAAVIVGGLGKPLGVLGAGIAIGVTEALTAAFASPAWQPLVSFCLLTGVLLLKPSRI